MASGRIRPASLLFVAPGLLFLHYVFWLGWHVYTGTCLHANDTQTARSLTAASTIFNFHFSFWSISHVYILLAVGASSLLKEKRTVKIGNSRKNVLKHLHSFSLQPAPMCLICQETIAVMKISNLKRHYETKHSHF